MALPGSSFAGGMPGEPTTPSVPRVNYGKPQATTRIPKVKTVSVKAHTRTIRSNGGTAAPKTTAPTAPAIDQTTKSLIDAAVRLKFGGQEQGLNQQLAANTRFANGAPAWYQQAVQQIKAQAQPVPQTAMPAPTGDPAQDSRNAAAYGYQQERNNAIGAGNQFLTNVGAGLTAASANSVNAANATRQNLLSQQTQLKGQEGDFRTTTMGDINAAQAKSDVENRKIQAGIYIAQGRTDMAQKVLDSLNQDRTVKNKIAKTNARTTRIKTAHDTMLADKKYNLDQQKFGAAQAKDNYQRTHGLGPYKAATVGGKKQQGNFKYTPSKITGFQDSWTNAQATAQQAKKNAKGGTTADEVYTAMLGHYNADIARAAALLAFGNPVTAQLRHRLAIKGIHISAADAASSLVSTGTNAVKKLAIPRVK